MVIKKTSAENRFLDFVHFQVFYSSGEWETPTLLGPIERTNLSHWTSDLG
jgi:hypothetical protein